MRSSPSFRASGRFVGALVLVSLFGATLGLSTTDAPRPLGSNDADDNDPRCSNVDIRNDLRRLSQIENCTVINGFLQMVLIERVPASEFAKYQLKNLREVTGYMLFFRVINLTSLRDLFPNLMVIRGQQLIGNYALVFYYMENMIEIGLKSLVAIQRGFVYSLHCPKLCHLDTIDWASITGVDNSTKNLNSLEPPKAVCNKSEVCRGCVPKFCWGSENCQKFYKGYNYNGIKCHQQCIGGCTNTTAYDCKVCRGWKEGRRCVEQCSADRLLYRPTKRCITHDACLERDGLLHDNECVLECPAGFSTTNVDQEQADFSKHKCFPCRHRCPKVCDGTEIQYLSDADRVRGCTIINGTLHIRLKEDHPNLEDELRNGLGDIEEIMGKLKVFRSNYIPSLDFLANLQIIHGQYTNDNSNFSLMVYENSNLQRLWNFEHKTSLRLVTGGMYFRNNELLCSAQIQLLRRIAEYDNASDTIDWNSNGFMQACHVQYFTARVAVLSSRNVTVYWSTHQRVNTHHRLLGFLIYYIRTTVDKSPYEGRDLCSKFGWKSRFVALENATIVGSFYTYTLTKLKPFTRYGCYVKTYFNESLNSATDRVGLSDMQYFKTAIDRPTPPLHVRTARKNDTAITLSWLIPTSEREMVSHYHVDVFIQPDERDDLDRRDFCLHPLETAAERAASESYQEDGSAGANGEGCSECCLLEDDYDLEEDEEEVTAPEGLLSEHTTIEETGRIGGRKRRRKRSVPDGTMAARPRVDDFAHAMLDLLREEGVDRNEHYTRRTRRDTDEFEFVNRIFYRDFTTDNYEYTVGGLRPYVRYIFQMFACSKNDSDYCSSYSLHTERTNASPLFDRLNVSVLVKEELVQLAGSEEDDREVDDDASSNITSTVWPLVKTTYENRIVLHFPEPIEVNGLTVAYRTELRTINGTYFRHHTDCFTRREHERRQYNYTLDRVGPGEYLVRAQLISLAGPGPFSEWTFVRILAAGATPDATIGNGLRVGLTLLAVVVALGVAGVAVAFLVYWWRKKRGTGRREDKIPLAANDGNQVNLDDGFVDCALK
uniref:receptor protein-tyrosine kinase n=1 Tax=Anopheles farauti TaxID=69004 RepID=A0A182Q8S0_9DIPT